MDLEKQYETSDEIDRLKEGIYSIVSSLVNKNSESALRLARCVMYGGSVNNPLDIENPKRERTQRREG